MKFFKSTYFLMGLSLLLLLPNLVPKPKVPLINQGHPWENYDPLLSIHLLSVSDVLRYTDSVAKVKGTDSSQLAYANELSEVVRNRFYHGYCYYSVNENWIAALFGSFVWANLSALVIADDILKYPNAACSQQSIVVMECFKRKGIDYRKVGFDHHFALEGMINGKWYFFDPDMEPDFSKNPRTSIDSILGRKEIYSIYKGSMTPEEVDYSLGNQFYGAVNAAPAPQASLFHMITKAISKILWLLPLGLIFYFRKKTKVGKGKEAEEKS